MSKKYKYIMKIEGDWVYFADEIGQIRIYEYFQTFDIPHYREPGTGIIYFNKKMTKYQQGLLVGYAAGLFTGDKLSELDEDNPTTWDSYEKEQK